MRPLGLALLAALLLCVGAASAAATKSRAPLRFGGMNEFSGMLNVRSAPNGDQLLRFLPEAHFELGEVLRNRSGARLTITDVRVLAPPRTLMHQIGTRFHRWSAPKCPPNVLGCLDPVFAMRPHTSQPRPFTLRPGKTVGVELDFVLGSCAQISGANPAPLSRVRVTFRRPDGTSGHRILPLGHSSLHLRTPKLEDCVDPHSSLRVEGPRRYTASSDRTVPGSSGDVCTIANGRLNFVSRLYRLEGSGAERIEFHLSFFHFRGIRTYHRGVVTVVAGGKPVFRTHRPVVTFTKLTRREVVATLEAGRVPAGTVRTLPFHVSGRLRCRVRR